MKPNRILVIAGTDSSGGAGLTRDTATAATLGFEVLPVVTAVTAQTQSEMLGSLLMDAGFVRRQIDAATASGDFQAVKVGMLGSKAVIDCVAEWLAQCTVPIVIDPVLKTSAGHALTSEDLPAELLSQADLLTPNLSEAALLTGRQVASSPSQISSQAQEILSYGAKAVLIKGGHGEGSDAVDHLFECSAYRAFRAPRLPFDKRGTGCTLAMVIACQLALGRPVQHACGFAKDYVHSWLQQPPVGSGTPRPLRPLL